MLPINDRMFVQDGYPLGNGQSRMDEAEVVGASRVLKQETVSFDERFSEQFCPGCGRGEAKQITGDEGQRSIMQVCRRVVTIPVWLLRDFAPKAQISAFVSSMRARASWSRFSSK